MLLQHTCTIERDQPIGTNGKQGMAQVATNVLCTFIPMTARAEIQNQYSVGTGWDGYFKSGANIRVGDRVTVLGRTLMIGGLMDYQGFPGVDHIHVTATTERGNG